MKTKNTNSGGSIDWAATLMANREPEQLEIPDATVNFYKEPVTLREYRDARADLKDSTWTIYEKQIKEFGAYLDRLGLNEPTTDDCANYIRERRDTKGPGSARAMRSTLLGFGSYLYDTGRASADPWAETDPDALRISEKYQREQRKQERGLYELEEVAKILIAIQHKDINELNRLVH